MVCMHRTLILATIDESTNLCRRPQLRTQLKVKWKVSKYDKSNTLSIEGSSPDDSIANSTISNEGLLDVVPPPEATDIRTKRKLEQTAHVTAPDPLKKSKMNKTAIENMVIHSSAQKPARNMRSLDSETSSTSRIPHDSCLARDMISRQAS